MKIAFLNLNEQSDEPSFQPSKYHARVTLRSYFGANRTQVILGVPELADRAVFLNVGDWLRPIYEDEAVLARLIDLLPARPTPGFVALPEGCMPVASHRWPDICHHVHDLWYAPPVGAISHHVVTLDNSHIENAVAMQPYIDEYGGPPYLEHLIETGKGWGIIQHGQLVASCFVLDDEVLGFLRVLPNAQRRGFASELVRHVCSTYFAPQRQAICLISIHNQASRQLFAGLGWKKSGLRFSWSRLRTDKEKAALCKGLF